MARNTVGQQAPNGNTDQMRYINVLLVDAVGACMATQIMTREFNDARDYVRSRVNEMALRSTHNTWDHPIISVYVFDNATGVLHRYAVTNHDITLPTIEEIQ